MLLLSSHLSWYNQLGGFFNLTMSHDGCVVGIFLIYKDCLDGMDMLELLF